MTATSGLRQRLLLVAEKAGWTFAEQLGVGLLAFTGAALQHVQPWAAAADAAGFAAVVSVITSGVTMLAGLHVTGWADAGARTGLTFLQSVAGTLLAGTTSLLHAGWRTALTVAVPVTVLAAVKCIAALGAPSIGASTVPVESDRKATS